MDGTTTTHDPVATATLARTYSMLHATLRFLEARNPCEWHWVNAQHSRSLATPIGGIDVATASWTMVCEENGQMLYPRLRDI
jgi:hypothetical protein